MHDGVPLPEWGEVGVDGLDRRLLNEFQRDFPLEAEPYRVLAERLGVDEGEVLARLERLIGVGKVSRVGVVLHPRRAGVSTLAAMRVPGERLEEVAEIVNRFQEVNHNYEREHAFNLWFVITARDGGRMREVVSGIEGMSGFPVYLMPMEESFHIDLGFSLKY
ncbi:MAG: AsnC family transcriptional regulator [Magnetococcales bacterium]|nr:AsnC family transcriptional regulator [Magnetococcales bacterium]